MVGLHIQDQERLEGSKEAVLMAIKRGVENDPLPGKKGDDRIHSQSPRAALRAVVCRKAVSWALKDTRKWSEENGEGRTPLPKACTALKVDAVQKLFSWKFHGRDDGCDPCMDLINTGDKCKRHKAGPDQGSTSLARSSMRIQDPGQRADHN
ncbi:Uncharacterized protein Rs2_48235 [Raphanus sativus]|nr:Uncharacterized protein Rs2_48235 [Raphanus sativus]